MVLKVNYTFLFLFSIILMGCIADFPIIPDDFGSGPSIPGIQTLEPATHITSYSVQLHAFIQGTERANIIQYGHCLSKTSIQPSLEDNDFLTKFEFANEDLSYVSMFRDLEGVTNYRARAYYSTPDTTIYSSLVQTFITGSPNGYWEKIIALPELQPGVFSFNLSNQLYLGGQNLSGNNIKFYKFLPKSLSFEQKTSLNINLELFSYINSESSGIIGSGLKDGNFSKDFWAYDLVNDSWIPISNITMNPRAASISFSSKNFSYLISGISSNGLENDAFKFQVQTQSWTEINSLPDQGRTGSITFHLEGISYIIGGIRNSEFLSSWYTFKHSDESWQLNNNLNPSLVSEGGIGFSIAGLGYAGLGEDKNGNFLQDLWKFNPEDSVWTKKGTFPFSGDQTSISVSVIMDTAFFSFTQRNVVGGELWVFVP